ncbi:enoyl-CoA hydratase/isomerase family protein [Parapedobacter lycopersici]|uniref:enoyl-CoA hydratase/isomerase family protein n=1 Tax=Parapedobacter lycopersici TaxID=1864939 RepID=UPI0033408D6D
MEPGFVKTEINTSGLAMITFSHPAHNALPAALLRDLADQIQDAGSKKQIRLILLRSAGEKSFCAGASFDELRAISDETAGKAFFSGFGRVINAMRRSPKLIIGRVQGRTVGGGVGLIAACDYCLATENAAVRLSEIDLGIGPFVIAPAIERKAGISALTVLSLNPTRFFDAYWAAQHGLFHGIHPDIAALDAAVGELAAQLTNKSQAALTALKQTLWRGTGDWEELLDRQAAISGRLIVGPEARSRLTKT